MDAALRRAPVAVWIGVAVVLVVGLVAGLGRASAKKTAPLTGRALHGARTLLASAAQLSVQADQDLDPRQRLKDIHTGLAYVAAARVIAADDVLQARCGVKVPELFAALRAQENQTTT